MDTKSKISLEAYRGPKYKRLYHALEAAVRSGTMEPGRKLPPVRDLAWQLGITPGTVARAYQMGTDEGLLEATVGRGTFVKGPTRTLPEVPANFVAMPYKDGYLNLRNGHTVELGQNALIGQLTQELVNAHQFNFAQYVRDEALGGCREQATEWLKGNGVTAHSSDLVLTNGAHNSVMVALNAILHGREPAIATTKLTYPGFRQTAHICRGRLLGIESDDEGILPDALELACRSERIQALLISSNVHNPTCVSTSLERRHAIAELAARYDFQIIEDDVYGTLITDKPVGFDHLCPERTWHASSLSKCFAAGLRVGFLQCPKGLGPLGLRVMQGMSLSISQLLTKVVERAFETGAVSEYGDLIAAENTRRVNHARDILKSWDVRSRDGVNYVWVGIPEGWSGSTFMSACEAQKLLVAIADKFTLPGSRAPNAVRLTLSTAEDFDALTSGLLKIDEILSNPPSGLLT